MDSLRVAGSQQLSTACPTTLYPSCLGCCLALAVNAIGIFMINANIVCAGMMLPTGLVQSQAEMNAHGSTRIVAALVKNFGSVCPTAFKLNFTHRFNDRAPTVDALQLPAYADQSAQLQHCAEVEAEEEAEQKASAAKQQPSGGIKGKFAAGDESESWQCIMDVRQQQVNICLL